MAQIGLPGADGTPVGGPWGGTMYPSWFTNGIGPQLQNRPEAVANLFADYVLQHPEMDFGWYWNNFKTGAPHAANRFGNGAPSDPYGQNAPPPAGNPPPPAGAPPPDTPPAPPPYGGSGQPTFGEGSGEPPRPTAPGGPTPGRWQRLISYVNGQRNVRWKWVADRTPPATTPPPGTTPPPVTPGPPVPEEPPAETPPVIPPPPPPPPDPGGWRTGPNHQQTTQPPVSNNPGIRPTSSSRPGTVNAPNAVRAAFNPGARVSSMPPLSNNGRLDVKPRPIWQNNKRPIPQPQY